MKDHEAIGRLEAAARAARTAYYPDVYLAAWGELTERERKRWREIASAAIDAFGRDGGKRP